MRKRSNLESLIQYVSQARGQWVGTLLMAAATGTAGAAAPANAPQVLLAVTNSQSMDGTTSGAIMVGSGTQGAGLASSSSPVNYAVPTGFTPPINTGSNGLAPYTATCGSFLCDNGPSRMNLAKQAIKGALDAYGNYLNFGLYAFNANVPGLYTTWVYHMSPPNGFTFVNTASSNTVPNPCYQYSSSPSATVKNNCGAIAPLYGGAAALGSFPHMQVSITSDNAQVNDVLYDGNANYASVFVNYQGPNPSSPYPPNYSLGNYNSGSVNISYRSVLPTGNPSNSGPTNAGYVPSTPQVMYAKRGFGYYATNYSSNTGQAIVAMGQPVSAFNAALSPQTSNPGSSEVKSLAGQSPIGGLLTGARSYLAGLTRQACQQQFVVLLTDGLPTRDLNGKNWPPLGSSSAAGYGVYATFNTDGTLASTNNVAVSDAISAVSNLAAAGIKTFVIGLGAGVDRNVNPAAADTLRAMAIAGGTTNFYPATDPASLNAAFLTIVDLIYKSSSIAAPVAPISVKSGNALEFSLTTDPSPRAGFVKAYAVDASGTPSATASWDAGASMSVANRTALLRSTATDGTLQLLSAIDDAAFNLPPSGSRAACVPDADTVRSFVINPSYTQGSCTYLGDRRANWFLGSFSTQNVGRYIGPPATPALINATGYGSYAVSSATRTPILMFSNNDGFLYGVDARTGGLLWGWTPRGVLGQMQNYTTFQTLQLMDGGLTVVDAKDASGAWSSYVIGSARSGAEHFSLKLGANGVPTRVVYDTTISSGYAPGDRAGATGSVPLHQSPQFLFVGEDTIAVYVVNVGTTSTLYEVNVATGATTSATLPFTLSSAIYVDPQFNRLWAGTSTGDIWRGALTGNATTDSAAMSRAATMINPSDNSTAVGPVLYVGYTEAKGVPYVYGITSSQMTVFSLGPTGWRPLWATTPSSGYSYTTRYTANSNLATMVTGSVVSDDIRVDGTTMIVPLFVPPTGCGLGNGYYAFFDLTSGKFPVNSMTYNGTAITGPLAVGDGAAFKLTSTVASSGNITLNGGTAGNAGAPSNPIKKPTRTQVPTNWKQQ